jgi:hypothetical protein
MFPGWRASDLFKEAGPSNGQANGNGPGELGTDLALAIARGLQSPATHPTDWQPSSGAVTAPSPRAATSDGVAGGDLAADIGRRLLALSRLRRFSEREMHQLSSLVGSLVDLELSVDIDVQPDGRARVTYVHEILNLTERPLTRVARDLWFENTTGKLDLRVVPTEGRRVAIQRLHDTASSSQFALQFSPPVLPGESAVASWTCEGVRFIKDHYWRQTIPRHARHLTILVRHREGQSLASCSAVETRPDGGENSIEQSLMWDYEGDDVVLTVTHDYLSPGQWVTLRWEVANEPAA